MKRSRDDVFAAIGAAMAENQGRALDRIDAAADVALAQARQAVSVRLQDYQPDGDDAAPTQAEWRYRLSLERALGGPLSVPAALRAWEHACEDDEESLTGEERELAQAWIRASQRAHIEGTRGLMESAAVWFEVSAVRMAVPAEPVLEMPAEAAPVVAWRDEAEVEPVDQVVGVEEPAVLQMQPEATVRRSARRSSHAALAVAPPIETCLVSQPIQASLF
ncbi:hypothetical protein [Xylophilus sp. GOD-11R]|uniref:hypothetical protein n=1 Tax=Xylophilus sp. GOD-11R TaxID=3089814 RepID=UPI00298D3A41|nr:hypothetical protein [Xylophilus sp. GOD-11R]WPB55175.1 hypothetical protein R9X41_13535 [Xylophilus sp. GOD-11R]